MFLPATALAFGGTTADRVELPIITGKTKWTVCCVTRFTGTLAANLYLWSSSTNSGGNPVSFIRIPGTSGDLLCRWNRTTTSTTYTTNELIFQTQGWKCIMVTFDQAASPVIKVYVCNLGETLRDAVMAAGNTDGTGAFTSDASATKGPAWGNLNAASPVSAWRGDISFGVLFGDRVLTLEEGRELFNDPFEHERGTGLLSALSLGMMGTKVQPDLSGNKNDGTVTSALLTRGPWLRKTVRVMPAYTRSAPSSTIFPYTMSGGLQSGGTSPASARHASTSAGGLQSGGSASGGKRTVAASSGGLQSGGAAAAGFVVQRTSSGGLQSGGSAPASARHTYAAAGGLLSSGSAGGGKRSAVTMAGGLNAGGAASAVVVHVFAAVASGGLTSGGAATISRKYGTLGSGGLNGGGQAGVTFQGTFTHTASGGLQSGGAAAASHRLAIVGVGGLQSGGAAAGASRRAHQASGGLTSNGAVTLALRYAPSSSGGLHALGSANGFFVFGGTIPAAWTANVRTYALLSSSVEISALYDARVRVHPIE